MCRIAALGLAQGLCKLSSDIDASGFGHASLSSMLFVADDSTIASSRFAQFVCIVSGIFTMWEFVKTPARQAIGVNAANYTHFRFTNLADRAGRQVVDNPGVAEFGILHAVEGDCGMRDAAPEVLGKIGGKYDELARSVTTEGASITIVFGEAVPYHGWFLKTADGGADTSNFEVQAKIGAPAAWEVVGRPSWSLTIENIGSVAASLSSILRFWCIHEGLSSIFGAFISDYLPFLVHSCEVILKMLPPCAFPGALAFPKG